jgi:outer membrane biosynthesis protein TonB
LRSTDASLQRFLVVSGALHLALALFLIIKGTLLVSPPKVYIPSLRVDLVALPDLKKTDTPELPTTEPAPEAPAKPAETKIETPPADEGEILLKKKNSSKKEKEAQARLKNALARIKALERIKAMAGAPVKGNQISKGSSLSGDAKTSLETTYFDVVLERVRNYWELPQWLQEQTQLSAQVTIFIDRQGRLSRFVFNRASGNESFDNEIKRTLQAAAPFPEPPIAILPDLAQEGILLGFPM